MEKSPHSLFKATAFTAVMALVSSTATGLDAPAALQPAGLNPGDTYYVIFVASAGFNKLHCSADNNGDGTFDDPIPNTTALEAHGPTAAAAGSVTSGVTDWQSLYVHQPGAGQTITDTVRANGVAFNNVVDRPIYNTQLQLVANDRADLFDGSTSGAGTALINQINFDEDGNAYTGGNFAFTGYNRFGNPLVPGDADAGTNSQPLGFGGTGCGVGDPDTSDANWVFAGPSNASRSIYVLSPLLTIPTPNSAPTISTALSDQSAFEDVAFGLSVASNFSDANGDTLTFSATGLPTGLSISSAGVISGRVSVLGSFTVTVTATDPSNAKVSSSFNLSVSTLDLTPPPPVVISGDQDLSGQTLNFDFIISEGGLLSGGSVSGNVENNGEVRDLAILANGSISGGTLTGVIENQGLLRDVTLDSNGIVRGGVMGGTINSAGSISDVELLFGASIEGGEVSGRIDGNSNGRATLNSRINPGTQLSYVFIGEAAVLDASVGIDDTVMFNSNENIPAGIILSNAFARIASSSNVGPRALDLDDSVMRPNLLDPTPDLLQSIQLLPEYDSTGTSVMQDPVSGTLMIESDEQRLSVVPVAVGQAGRDTVRGTSINDDGDLRLVTTTQREVIAYPVLEEPGALAHAATTLGLSLTVDDRGNLLFSTGTDSIRYSVRPNLESTPVPDSELGFITRPSATARGIGTLFFVFEDGNGQRRQQQLLPSPMDWLALKTSLNAIEGVSDVRISTDGVITTLLGGVEVKLIADFITSASTGDASGVLSFEQLGDLNGDGTVDAVVTFADGSQQQFFILP